MLIVGIKIQLRFTSYYGNNAKLIALMYWMVESAMINKYEYMKMITNMAKLFFFIKSRVKRNKLSSIRHHQVEWNLIHTSELDESLFRFYPAFYKK